MTNKVFIATLFLLLGGACLSVMAFCTVFWLVSNCNVNDNKAWLIVLTLVCSTVGGFTFFGVATKEDEIRTKIKNGKPI